MKQTRKIIQIILVLLCCFAGTVTHAEDNGEIDLTIRIKELGRIAEARDNMLVGYGLVTGLAGTGDSTRSAATYQSVANVLKAFGVNVVPKQVRGRNVASVMVTAILPPFAGSGDKLDVNITSMGDARSLVGGTLLRAHLIGPGGRIFALAQGQISVGGFSYDLNGNLVQKNHPTAGYVPNGAIVEQSAQTTLVNDEGFIEFVLANPDFTTSSRIVEALQQAFGQSLAKASNAGRIQIRVPRQDRNNVVGFITKIENTKVQPDVSAKVVVNERTGTVVAGGNVKISPVSITHGDLNVSISTDYSVSQPMFVRQSGSDVRTAIVPKSTLEVKEDDPLLVSLSGHSTVMDLVTALYQVKASSRDIITILQSIKRAGSLHAEIIIQ
ncbi:MAG: flagellar basal body P-ring protein FlgI [Gammaproteobacteria bacterium]|nr:flagellar basal body P-ring protein FlgI [Gammaproteobacteria bacterium]MDH5730104.1 flagellar basal body P-ring protein FlgI [Gammaproteobacteria bacterium]